MISRISCFNRAIFRRSLRRTAPLWVVYLIFWVIALPLQLLIGFSRVRYEVSDLQSAILTAAQMGSSFVCFLYGAACAWLIFYWLFRSRSAYFYASLPVRRETVFVTDYCAGLVVGLVPNVAVFLLSLGATAMDYSKLQNGSDIRGIALEGIEGQHVNLTEQACRDIGRGFALWLQAREPGKTGLRVAVGRDSRLAGPALAGWIDGAMMPCAPPP